VLLLNTSHQTFFPQQKSSSKSGDHMMAMVTSCEFNSSARKLYYTSLHFLLLLLFIILFHSDLGESSKQIAQRRVWPSDNKKSNSILFTPLGRVQPFRSIVTSLARDTNRPVSKEAVSGCWRVVETRGEPEWTKYSGVIFRLLKAIGVREGESNNNYQIFSSSPSKRTFVNLSEYLGSSFYATASGDYQILSDSEIKAMVDRISIHFDFGREGSKLSWNISVKGEGLVSVLHLDDKLRVFTNEDGASVLQEKVALPASYQQFQ